MYSLSLKDVVWLEDTQLIFLIFHTFVCKFGWINTVVRKKIYTCQNGIENHEFQRNAASIRNLEFDTDCCPVSVDSCRWFDANAFTK